jgi:hypothetical protein
LSTERPPPGPRNSRKRTARLTQVKAISVELGHPFSKRRWSMNEAMFYDTMQVAIALAIVVVAVVVGRYFNRHFQ